MAIFYNILLIYAYLLIGEIMKKIMLSLLLILISFNYDHVCAKINVELNSKSAIVIEESSKKVLFEKNSNEKLAPASMTKIMTLLLIAEAIEDGRLSLDKEVLASEYAVSMGGSQVYLEANSKYKVSELIKAIGVGSANDAAVVLAEVIGGTVENFVAMMNAKVKELGLKNTNFKNPHGLDEANHYSSAYDMAIIASELVKYSYILDVTSTYEDNFTHPNGKSIWLVNTNSLIRFYDGVDGLKTGYTSEAGYCLTATKKVGDMRIITVTMNAETKEARNTDTIKLMETAFSMFNVKTVINSANSLGQIFVDKSPIKYVDYYLEEDAKILFDSELRDINYDYEIELNDLTAPLSSGEIIGKLKLKYDNETVQYNLVVKDEIKKATFFQTIISYFKDVISGNINFIKN